MANGKDALLEKEFMALDNLTWSFPIFGIYSVFFKKARNKVKFRAQISMYVTNLRRKLS